MRPENSTTRNTIWNVTDSTSPSWNSFHAEVYQRVVQPCGSQLRSQRVAKEFVTTVAIIAKRLRTKKPTRTQTAVAQSFAPMVVSRIIGSTFPAGGRAAVEEAAGGQDRSHDGEL